MSERRRRLLRDATRVIHAGVPAPAPDTALLGGPVLAAPFHLSGDPHDATYVYGRYGNPTWSAYERALAELEGGEAVLFASGMAAVSAVALSLLAPGDAIVVPTGCYQGVRSMAGRDLDRWGVEVRLVDAAQDAIAAAIPGARLVWVETPSNPLLDVVDIGALADAAHAAGALLVADNTLATPLAQRPLALRADLAVTSASKYLTGHGDLVLGYVAARDPEAAGALRDWRTRTGAIAGPLEVWLAHRSLATLELRLARQCASALTLAQLLAGRPDVSGVRYPGLPDHPAHALAARQMAHFGGVVGFTLPDRETAERFLAAAELVAEATSFGGVHTTAERRARWGGDAVDPGFIRLSVGCEDCDDLAADLTQALDAAR